MAILTAKDFVFTGFTGLRCEDAQIGTRRPVFDVTRDTDTALRIDTGDQSASGRVTVVLSRDSSGDTIPLPGVAYDVTYATDSDKTYSDTITITSSTYDPRLSPGMSLPQRIEMEFVIGPGIPVAGGIYA